MHECLLGWLYVYRVDNMYTCFILYFIGVLLHIVWKYCRTKDNQVNSCNLFHWFYDTFIIVSYLHIRVNGKFEITRVIIYNVIRSTSRLHVFTKICQLYLVTIHVLSNDDNNNGNIFDQLRISVYLFINVKFLWNNYVIIITL